MRTRKVFVKWLMLAVVCLCVVAAFPAAVLARTYSAQETAFIQLINDYRQQQGLSRLLVSDLLSDAAQKHNSDMGKYSFFSHTTLASDYFAVNSTPWARMAACGYDFNTYRGENIAAGYSTADGVFAGWKASAGHNQIMLTAQYAVIGISQVYVAGSVYGHYWTADFGGYVDATAHELGTTSTTRPATTTSTQRVTTTTRPATTTTTRPATTTTQRLTTTTRAVTTTTRPVTTTTGRFTTTTRRYTTTTRRYTTTTQRFTTTTARRYTPTTRPVTTTTRRYTTTTRPTTTTTQRFTTTTARRYTPTTRPVTTTTRRYFSTTRPATSTTLPPWLR